MKVEELIKQLQALDKTDAEITLVGNTGNPDDEEHDLTFSGLEIWNDGEESITLFLYRKL